MSCYLSAVDDADSFFFTHSARTDNFFLIVLSKDSVMGFWMQTILFIDDNVVLPNFLIQ
jgi:hypothetical protein